MRLSGESLFAIAGPQPWRGARGFRMTEHDAVRATPPGFDYRVDVLPGVYTPGYCMPRLRRFEPYTPPAFRTMAASGGLNHATPPAV